MPDNIEKYYKKNRLNGKNALNKLKRNSVLKDNGNSNNNKNTKKLFLLSSLKEAKKLGAKGYGMNSIKLSSTPGLYLIVNKVNGVCYIGQTKNLVFR